MPTFRFTDISVPNVGTTVQAVWDFGDGSPQVTMTYPGDPKFVDHEYTQAGTYDVTLTATGNLGAVDVEVKQVVITLAPSQVVFALFNEDVQPGLVDEGPYEGIIVTDGQMTFTNNYITTPFFNSDGTLTYNYGGDINSPLEYVTKNWYYPTTPDIGENYYIRISRNFDLPSTQYYFPSLSSGDGVWTKIADLHGTASYLFHSGPSLGNVTYEFSDSPTGDNILMTINGTFGIIPYPQCFLGWLEYGASSIFPVDSLMVIEFVEPGTYQFSDNYLVNVGEYTSIDLNFGDGSPTVTRNYPADSKVFSHTYTEVDVNVYVEWTSYGNMGAIQNKYEQLVGIDSGFAINEVTPGTYDFTDNNYPELSGVVSTTWDFGDGSPLITHNYPADSYTVQHTYSVSGVYDVIAITSGSLGGSQKIVKQVSF